MNREKLRFALRHLHLIAEAWWWLLLARPRRRPFPSPVSNGPTCPVEVLLRCFQIAAGHHLYRPACLPRSIALQHFLQRHGHPAVLRIGVRKEGGRLRAHAWVEVGGELVDDDPANVRGYRPLEP